jgi:hypothetical protein
VAWGLLLRDDNGEFLIAKPQDEAGEWLPQDSEDHQRFPVARDGDNLVTLFQCDFCHFVNIMYHCLTFTTQLRLTKQKIN